MDDPSNLLVLIAVVSTCTLGLVVLALIMQAANFTRLKQNEAKIKGMINDLRFRK